ncbi:alpha/beta-hydrolase [Apiospora phragmitis]|uniref:Alpha/beta-hydrolase n=1 Tax=Apiospora phragmitis TaxID=2905665 RepID=A0ABR1X779_9PEZI
MGGLPRGVPSAAGTVQLGLVHLAATDPTQRIGPLFAPYAHLFPDSVRAMALDGIVQHSQSASSNGQDVEAVFSGLLDRARQTPIPAPGCSEGQCRATLSDEDVLFALRPALNNAFEWPGVGQTLAEAAAQKNGNATLLSSFADSKLYAATAVSCQDWDVFHPSSTSSTLAEFLQLQHGEMPILLVNALYDPTTSYAWALGLKQELGGDGRVVLLTREGAGHTSYLPRLMVGGEAMPRINAYLLDLTLPEPGTVVDL